MFDEIRSIIQEINKAPDEAARSAAMNAFVVWTIVQAIYYIAVAVVVIILGRRIIFATTKAWKESQREPS